jgi:hypothetical protein
MGYFTAFLHFGTINATSAESRTPGKLVVVEVKSRLRVVRSQVSAESQPHF